VTREPLHVPAASGRPVLDGRLTLKIGADETREAYSLLRGNTPPGLGPPLHVHEREDETFYVLSGTYDMQCGAEVVRVDAGSCVHLPRYIPHTFRNASDEPAALVEFITPGGIERYFDAVGHLGPEATDLIARSEVARPFGISFVEDPSAYLEPPPGEKRRSTKVVRPEQGRRLELWGCPATCIVEREDAGGLHTLHQVSMPPGATSPPWAPDSEELLAFGLEGAPELRQDGRHLTIGPGEAVAVAPGLEIALRNPGSEPATFLLFAIPVGGADF
jgi:mannose-6-phosphate isomerase-like protein (cupin superfamily)